MTPDEQNTALDPYVQDMVRDTDILRELLLQATTLGEREMLSRLEARGVARGEVEEALRP